MTVLSIMAMCDHPTGVRTVHPPTTRGPAPQKRYRGYCKCGWEGPRRVQAHSAEDDTRAHVEEACAVEPESVR